MKFKLVFLSLALFGCSGAAPPSDPDSMQPASEMPQEHVLVSFDADAVGAMPRQFLASRTGGGREGVWRIEQVEGAPSGTQAVVQTDLCASCGICAGACPSSTPFRSVTLFRTGIEMPQRPMGVPNRYRPMASMPAPCARLRPG